MSMQTNNPSRRLVVDLQEHLHTPLQRTIYRAIGPMIERTFGLRGFDDVVRKSGVIYREHAAFGQPYGWFDSVLKYINATYDSDVPADFEIPPAGPLIIVANHPFGILDPVILAHYVSKVRPDLRIMTNSMLTSLEDMRPFIIPVNPFGGKEATRSNLRAMKESIRLLKNGGALAIFPAGEVASYKPGLGIEEPPWTNQLGSLVRRTQATVLPVYFPGRNSTLFHAAGLVHPRLRTSLLLREFCNARDSCVEMRVGNPIPYTKLKKFDDDEAMTKYLRIHTLVLAERRKVGNEDAGAESDSPLPLQSPTVVNARRSRIIQEVDSLRTRGGKLVGLGGLSVYCAHSHEIPETLQEIGRLRETTFRDVGEGTGLDVDLDKFDRYYEHIFLWDEHKEQIAGAYRLGRADMILREYGPDGLYTSTLFRFAKPFLASLETAVEMGRSFISKEYQKNLSSLPLLWKGIAHWMVRNPGYKKLFGPVSISKDYDKLSRKFMVEFLQDNCLHEDLASFVKPRNPFRYLKSRRLMREFISAELKDVDDCSALISSVETDGKGIPILLKHYLRLNGTILSFNVDKDFSSVIDGLILVDLTETEPRLLTKYMGEENCRAYLARHKKEAA